MKKGISTMGAIGILLLALIVHAIKMAIILLIFGLIAWIIVSFYKSLFVYGKKVPLEEKSANQQEEKKKDNLKISENESNYDKEKTTLYMEYQNQLLTEEYFKLIKYKKQLAKEIRELSDLNLVKRNEAIRLSNRNQAITSYSLKPMLMSKEKYLDKMASEVNENKEKITLLENEKAKIEKQIEEKRKIYENLGLDLCDKRNKEFKNLENALDRFKNSKKIKGNMTFDFSAISDEQRNNDLRYVKFNTEPYTLSIDKKRFYIFPDSIWEFEDDEKLLGIFTPNVLSYSFSSEEIKLDSIHSSKYVAEDTKIIVKKIPHTTWLHTRIDGTPDRRYKNNPQSTYYTDEEYYLKCEFELILGDNSLSFDVSSYDNCELLKNAIDKYSNQSKN